MRVHRDRDGFMLGLNERMWVLVYNRVARESNRSYRGSKWTGVRWFWWGILAWNRPTMYMSRAYKRKEQHGMAKPK
jgi:hypothetical protein